MLIKKTLHDCHGLYSTAYTHMAVSPMLLWDKPYGLTLERKAPISYQTKHKNSSKLHSMLLVHDIIIIPCI